MNIIRSSFSSHQFLCIGTLGLLSTFSSFGIVPAAQASETISETISENTSETAEDTLTETNFTLPDLQASTTLAPYSTQADDLRLISNDISDAIVPFTSEDLIAQDRMSDFGREQSEEVELPPSNGEIISAIEVRFIEDEEIVEDGKTREFIITREFDIEPGDVYDLEKVQDGLQRLNNLNLIQSASVIIQPTENPEEVVMVVTVDEVRSHFGIDFGLTVPHPSALQGVTVPETVLSGTNRSGGVAGGIQFQWRNLGGNNQTIAAGIEGGENAASYDVSFTDPWIATFGRQVGYSVNFFNVREVPSVFDGGDEVELPNDNDPWVHRLGGGFEFFLPFSDSLAIATGLSYQRVSARDGAFTGAIFPEDELGNPLTFSDDGRDDVLTTSFSGAFDRRDNREYATRGYRLLFRNDLYIPIGEANIAADRISANYTHYVPIPFFGADDPSVFIFNVQGGTVIGDLPPYEAFNLGGASSVRGYEAGEVGSGRSFVQGTIEYRFPLFDFNAFKREIDIGGTLFVDYANDLGSGDTVRGEPAEVRDKPGDGAGFGGGVHARTPFGLMRLEAAVNDEGDSEVFFQIGDRF
ncbi:MAG: BamA/TamA family outer membrane protein [Leptolyngbyaceae bacterium]|nr:BamA/TamA family outer membrane protein [Leptolyngbyaceae bacterium]